MEAGRRANSIHVSNRQHERGLSSKNKGGVAIGKQRELIESHVNKMLESIPDDLGPHRT
jgi:hypothetical protein